MSSIFLVTRVMETSVVADNITHAEKEANAIPDEEFEFKDTYVEVVG